jgi:hypothetical protein
MEAHREQHLSRPGAIFKCYFCPFYVSLKRFVIFPASSLTFVLRVTIAVHWNMWEGQKDQAVSVYFISDDDIVEKYGIYRVDGRMIMI